MLDITSIFIIWFLITGISILVSTSTLYKKFSELRKLRVQVETAEKELVHYINQTNIEELSRTQSGQELLQSIEVQIETIKTVPQKNKARGLNEKHIRILEFLTDYQAKYGRPPSIHEIGKKVKISPTSVSSYLNQLNKMGYLERDEHIARGLRLTDKVNEIIQSTNELLRIPILGPIAAGPFMLVPEPGTNYMNDKEYDAVDIARSFLPSSEKGNDLYALEVKGDSMVDAMINDGDIIIMKQSTEARNGEMVAVRVNDEYTLKYFYEEKDHYRLQPANPTMKPIILKKTEQPEINGKVVIVIRSMIKKIE